MFFLPKKTLISLLVLILAASLFLSLASALANEQPKTLKDLFFETGLKDVGTLYGYPSTEPWSSPTYYVARIVRIILTLMGTLFLVLIVYGGLTWMTAGGNEEQVKKATAILKNAAIGIVIVFAAYVITWFVVRELYEASTGIRVPYSTHTWPWPDD